MHKVWIEVALNGASTSKLQPRIPDTVEAIVAEGIACARAGAAIVHTHAYQDGKHVLRLAGLCPHHRRHPGRDRRAGLSVLSGDPLWAA